MILTLSVRRITLWLVAFTLICTVLGLIGILQTYDVRFRVFSRFFDLNSESTVSTWYAALLIMVAAVVCGLITWDHTQRRRPYARYWGYLTLILLLMSADEIAMIHEDFLAMLGVMMGGGSGVFHYAWTIPALCLVAGFGLLYLRFFVNLPPETRRMLLAGLALFIGGAVGMEMVAGWAISNFDAEGRSLELRLLIQVEEVGEMLGMCAVIHALLSYLNTYCRFDIRIGAQKMHPASDEADRYAQPISGEIAVVEGEHARMAQL